MICLEKTIDEYVESGMIPVCRQDYNYSFIRLR